LNAWLGVASRSQGVSDVRTPANNLLVLVVVEDCGNLLTNCQLTEDLQLSALAISLTFCFVCVPAPGHSTMISSLASVLVANAKATPEKVVPCGCSQ
jgi:hypothetical protein